MFNDGSSPTVRNCDFVGNTANGSAGMANQNSSHPTVSNCIFWGNASLYDGAGMGNFTSSPAVSNCTFTNNWSGIAGGGMANNAQSHPTVTHCTFSENSAESRGGGMYSQSTCSPAITNCVFTDNYSWSGGGILNITSSNPVLINCTLSGNGANYYGGGIHNYQSSPVLINCTLAGNWSRQGSGGGLFNQDSNPIVTNCVFWGNSAPTGAQIHDIAPSSSSVTYCDVQGTVYAGTGNINSDPGFVDGDGPDNDPCTGADNDLRLGSSSPCIDAGDDSAVPADSNDLDNDSDTVEPLPWDLADNPRFMSTAVDMGAYEFQGAPSVPSIAKDKSSIDLGETATSEDFQVWNDGIGSLSYSVSVSQGGTYFSVTPGSGSSSDSDDKQTHSIAVDRSAMAAGQNVTGQVTISSGSADDSPQYIDLSASKPADNGGGPAVGDAFISVKASKDGSSGTVKVNDYGFDLTDEQLQAAGTINISFYNAPDSLEFFSDSFARSAGTHKVGKKGKQGKYTYKGTSGKVSKLKLLLEKDTCSVMAKKINLSAWTGGDVTVRVEIGAYLRVVN